MSSGENLHAYEKILAMACARQLSSLFSGIGVVRIRLQRAGN
jgi:hypothetical protein